MPPQYKFVEVSPVTGETLEAAVNEWVAKGWQLEGIRFVVTEQSTRPSLAFVSFVLATPEVAVAGPSAPAVQAGPSPGPRPLTAPEAQARVITAPHGTDVD
jgi:hypothetical protein